VTGDESDRVSLVFQIGKQPVEQFIVQTQGVCDRIERLQQGPRARIIYVVQVLEQPGRGARIQVDAIQPIGDPARNF